jgi:hypothetical protein
VCGHRFCSLRISVKAEEYITYHVSARTFREINRKTAMPELAEAHLVILYVKMIMIQLLNVLGNYAHASLKSSG